MDRRGAPAQREREAWKTLYEATEYCKARLHDDEMTVLTQEGRCGHPASPSVAGSPSVRASKGALNPHAGPAGTRNNPPGFRADSRLAREVGIRAVSKRLTASDHG